jgi:hypothetical protein
LKSFFDEPPAKATRIALACTAVLVALAGVGYAYLHAGDVRPEVRVLNPRTATPQLFALGADPPFVASAPPQPSRSPAPIVDNASMLARYDRLAKSANPADNKIAYDMVQRCRDTRWATSRDPELTDLAREECGDLVMRPGILDDPAYQLALVERAAQAGVHRAYLDLFRNEYKKGRMPPGPETEQRLEELRKIALSTADPYALAEESVRAQIAGDKAAELALFVAYRTALARDRGDPYDPATDRATLEKAGDLPEATAKAAIAKGTEFVAAAYRTHK